MNPMRKRIVLALAVVLLVGGAAAIALLPTRPASTEAPSPAPDGEDVYVEARRQMVEEGIVGWGITDPEVVAVMEAVPRHLFVPPEYLDQAYENHPLPIGLGQTISQPYIVALMTEYLELEPGEKVLEIGTGSGYQAAVLAEMGVEVYSIEILLPLAERAAERLGQVGYAEVHTRAGDGYFGWPEEAPFDAIIVTAAPDHVPQPLLAQLAIGGVMVIPVGPPGGYQELWQLRRESEDQVVSTNLGGVRFVPLVRQGEGGSPNE
jgi:protein-L-isoaspartate(D-aspartate) O-methyltransferase